MAIYSCNLASVGRTTHAAGTAGAHLRYICREGAQAHVETHAMPHEPNEARAWMDRAEQADRKNARVADKIRLAIPRELSRDERAQLVRDFCEDITGNRVPWMFAVHQDGHDAHNPHAHIVIRDRDLTTGKRVLRLSDSARDREAAGLEPSACHWVRERWELCANLALERAGCDERIDRRTLEAQGIEREPTIHIGPRAQHIDEFVQRPRSRTKTNGVGREIDYLAIDGGKTRKDHHAEIIDLNLERDARSPNFETRVWAQFHREQHKQDRRLEAQLAEFTRRRTTEERALKAGFREQLAAVKTQRRAAYQETVVRQRQSLAPRVAAMRTRQADERETLRVHQTNFWSRVARAIDITGGTRRKHHAAKRAMTVEHKAERSILARVSREEWLAHKAATTLRFASEESRLIEQRAQALKALKEMHRRGEAMADARRQLRESEREQARLRTVEAVRVARVVTPDRKAEEGRSLRPAVALDAGKDRARTGFAKAQTDQEKAERRKEELRRRFKESQEQAPKRTR